eukprot:8374208-Lingulodinium_polyedra.AAC.1
MSACHMMRDAQCVAASRAAEAAAAAAAARFALRAFHARATVWWRARGACAVRNARFCSDGIQ